MLHDVLPVVAEDWGAEEIGVVDRGPGGMARESAAATLGSAASTRREISTPLMSGKCTSSTTTSGISSAISRSS